MNSKALFIGPFGRPYLLGISLTVQGDSAQSMAWLLWGIVLWCDLWGTVQVDTVLVKPVADNHCSHDQ